MSKNIQFKLRKSQQSLVDKKYALDLSIERLSYKAYKVTEDFWGGFIKDHPELDNYKEALAYRPETKTVEFKHKWQEDDYKKMLEG